RAAGRRVEVRGEYRVYECFIDGTFAKARGGCDRLGRGHLGNGAQIMALVHARGLPVAIDVVPGDAHESRCVQALFDFMRTSETPPRVIGDKAYNSDPLDEQLAERGVEMIAPHRGNRKPANVTQDRRPLRRAARRWTVERTISWIQNYRRLSIRWERSSQLFSGFPHLSCALLLLSAVLR
ncbi:MAG TPA: IS5 family transposase, partial [Methylomirabilota bacterium]|nr:IS5 family transposase [Methylomirabilota bacterium]